ncbi:hypothetical protein LEL_06695 [Akanthomyces lecanii RCEF 1005]|uniref:Uncharacterized protein n=1 Tax=Akanthomyces lecanii RCEF 1005 TaxID=1081108 RepID=A0A168GWK6_CORDF|nr:hypothetical protein LEL_06695 [Akanthomyces lecanii RCEF 1005]
MSINFERYVYLQFSHGFDLWRQDRLSHPELTIMRLVNDITDRDDWRAKIADFSTCRVWREEAFASYFPKSLTLWDWCVFELRKKAIEFASSRSVFVFDSASRIRKSDRLAGTGLFQNLKLDTESLDLSPWMLPFVFEVSPIRIDGRPITLDNFLDAMTVGAICPRSNWDPDRLNNGDPSYYSGKSQWLATDVKFSGKDDSVTIVSLINNLHPHRHKSLYVTLEHLLPGLVDEWNQTLLYKALPRGVSRIRPKLYKCGACSADILSSCSCPVDFRDSSAWASDCSDNVTPDTWHERRWNPVLALDGRFVSSRRIYGEVSLRDGFGDRGLQIYVEISTIKLGPDGAVSTDSLHHMCWDLNGNRNERVVATSLICLRRENIDPASGGISFRSETKRNAWEDRPNECQTSDPEVVAGLSSAPPGPPTVPNSATSEDEEHIPSFQELGTVQLPEGRIVTYPNTLQHKFETPKLKESSESGSFHFMQIHLVDPHYIVCSTQFVPPQSLELWKEAIDYERICLKNQIPLELSNIIIEHLFIPERWLNKKKKKVRGLQNYWQTWPVSFEDKDKEETKQRQLQQARQPPVRYESALRRKQEALQRHERVMRAVNGPKMHSPPRAITVWVQSMLRDPGPLDDNDPRDRANALAPETENSMQNTEEEDIADFDSPLSVATSSGSEGSTDGEEHSAGGSDDDEDDDGGGGGDGGIHDAHGGGDAAAAAVAQDEAAGEGSDEEEDYVDALYGLTSAELAEIEAMTHPNQEEEPLQEEEPFQEAELESLYDDAMSQANEMELYDID